MTTEAVSPDNRIANTQYIQGLDYKLDKILAIDLTPKQVTEHVKSSKTHPGPTHESTDGQVTITTKKVRDASSELTENSLLNPGAGVVFPGALLKQDRKLAEGVPTPYHFQRGPLTIRVDLPGLKDKGVATIESPTNVAVPQKIEEIVEYWFDNVQEQTGYKSTTRAYSESHKAYSKEQIGIDCGFGAQWGQGQATAGLKAESTSEETIVYRIFKQIYYTVYIEEPESPGDMFARGVKLDATNMSDEEPPGFVRSVDYGRIIILQMTTTGSVTEEEAEATLEYKSAGTGFKADLKQKYEHIAETSSFKAFVLGGGGTSAKVLWSGVDGMNEAIKDGIEFSKDNSAYPVSFVVADLKSRSVSTMKTTTQFIETETQVLHEHRLKVRHTGGFVANFIVTWEEFALESQEYVEKAWNTGDHSAPYEDMRMMAADVRNIKVDARRAVFFGTWRGQQKYYDFLDSDKDIHLGGSTINPTLDCTP